MSAAVRLLDRLEGKPRQAVEMSGKDGGPIQTQQVARRIREAGDGGPADADRDLPQGRAEAAGGMMHLESEARPPQRADQRERGWRSQRSGGWHSSD
jgi:hypothetical protein